MPVVSVLCVACNHAFFICEAIEGGLVQETTFPVELVIHDDASTDGATKVIREYEAVHPQVFHNVIQTHNVWPNVRGLELSSGHYLGEFIALC